MQHEMRRPDAATNRPAPNTDTHDNDTEDGSVVSEYGLVAVLGATIAGLAISWAKGGAIASLLATVLKQLRTVAGG